jgi:arylsulfatase A-like enzyme
MSLGPEMGHWLVPNSHFKLPFLQKGTSIFSKMSKCRGLPISILMKYVRYLTEVHSAADSRSSQTSGANWIRQLPRQSEENVEYNDEFYRSRLRALQAVDELVEGVFERLESHGLLDNTYVIYSTDNGYHIGQHRMQPGKECGYEEDINIPLIIRGPGVAKGVVSELVTTHTDLAPTILNLIREAPRPDFDGLAIPVTPHEIAAAIEEWHEHVNVEYWGFALGEGKFGSGCQLHTAPDLNVARTNHRSKTALT